MQPAAAQPTAAPRYWARTLRVTIVLTAAWALVTLGLPAFAGVELRVFGFPVGFWLMAQGSLLLYLAIVVVYVVWMERIERGAGAGPANGGAES